MEEQGKNRCDLKRICYRENALLLGVLYIQLNDTEVQLYGSAIATAATKKCISTKYFIVVEFNNNGFENGRSFQEILPFDGHTTLAGRKRVDINSGRAETALSNIIHVLYLCVCLSS